jgi:hypothetical protein
MLSGQLTGCDLVLSMGSSASRSQSSVLRCYMRLVTIIYCQYDTDYTNGEADDVEVLGEPWPQIRHSGRW